ncbi:Glycosyltransferase involved in cell wall bisynthesis [Pseudomonas sp. ok272]|uniref:glycosyltransferase n=1 Tax=unclassified Pseudomonas TaxID=196821 RepID=UPI0008D0C22E|nr:MULTISPECIES: glycosyltransferase [unclassified Pseudomonas]SEM61751.1 Glycosyltransferase involved in cell wall bisynthesis [Pseudomonas sp. ok272]SFM48423.1 Glycosyltransferase involved in cell wall bisynthesis [Pseudomonas sp. ok602]
MNFILYSDVNDRSICQSLGRPEYSYYFVLKAYRPLFESLGRVHVVASIAEVDPLYQQLLASGENSLFVSFTPLQKTPRDIACPTICVVAWEFDSIPDEQWDNDPRQDWTQVLAGQGRVITLSSHTAHAIRRAMGEDFPVLVLPTPLWESFATLRNEYISRPINPGSVLEIKGCILDTRVLGLSADALIAPPAPTLTAEQLAEIEASRPPPLTLKRRFVIAKHYLRMWALDLGKTQAEPVSRTHFLKQWYQEGVCDLFSEAAQSRLAKLLPSIAGRPPVESHAPPARIYPDITARVETQVDGVVYASVFNPKDGRKNWHQLITAFCWAFRDTADATLVLKITHNDLSSYYDDMMTVLAQLSPFACRVVVMHGYLDDPQYARLYAAASFYVNASRCEGLCLPLMEFMACGKPVIAPAHTAMQDYIDEQVAFVVAASEELTIWPQDTRILYRTLRHRPDWGSLKMAYLDSYAMAKERTQDYQRMSQASIERMHEYCAFPLLQQRAADFFEQPVQVPQATTARDNASC